MKFRYPDNIGWPEQSEEKRCIFQKLLISLYKKQGHSQKRKQVRKKKLVSKEVKTMYVVPK